MTAPPDDRVRLMRLVTGHIVTASLYCVAKLGVVDAMPVGAPMPVDDVAARVGAEPDALYRVLRALAGEGLFAETEPRSFEVTELGEWLRDGAGSFRYLALMHGGQTMPLFVHMLDTVRTGTPVPILREGKTRWEQLAEDPEQSAIFNRAMRGRATALAAVLSEVDWSGTTHVVDVGGGIGGVLLPVLRKHTHVRGTLFDLDHIADDARAAIADAGLTDRCDFVAGSFFESVPEGADAYVLSNILHDWNDDDSGRILATCRAAVRDDSRLLVLENLVPPGDDRHPVKVLDLQMMVALGGRERTEDEYRELLRAHGFTLVRVTGAAPAALEATPS